MEFDVEVDSLSTFEDNFQLEIIFTNFHKYLCDRLECKHILTLHTTKLVGYNILKGRPTLNPKYWHLCQNHIL